MECSKKGFFLGVYQPTWSWRVLQKHLLGNNQKTRPKDDNKKVVDAQQHFERNSSN